MRTGQKIPERIANAPELQLGLQFFIQAFFDLDSERSHGMGLTAIPWRSVQNYAQCHNLNDDETEDLHFLIRKLDAHHLKRLNAKMQANNSKG